MNVFVRGAAQRRDRTRGLALRGLAVVAVVLGASGFWASLSRAEITMAERLEGLIGEHDGQVAVAVEHLETGESYAYRADVPMPTASLIKVPVMIEAYRQDRDGRIDLDSTITLQAEDKVPGSGILTDQFSDGAPLLLRDAVRLMIAYSDNTATNLVLDRIGIGATARRMAQLGFPETQIHSKVYRRDTSVAMERSRQFGLGSTTASDMVALFGMIYRDELVDAEACRAMRDHLKNCQDTSMFRRLLPAGTTVYHKTGAVSPVRTSAAILETPAGPVALCVLTAENADRRWSDDNAAERLLSRIALEVYNHFQISGPEAESDADGPEPLRKGDNGPRVETLQRALNRALEPSPELSVDGDFGPATEGAVLRFQEQVGLNADGIVGPATLEKLGSSEPPTVGPTPEQVNAEVLPLDQPDPLDGAPFVTAASWVIADAETGAILQGASADQPRDMASTTKIMTARLVLKLAEDDPSVLDEVVTFSERADAVIGSSATVRAGERLSVGELLYGLLLPSGNDASVALAEHFGARFAAPEMPENGEDPTDPLVRFVAEMNREADRLGLAQTGFANPHGLTAPNHKASAADLARLAYHCLESSVFRTIVATRQYAAELVGPEGRRTVVWRNTNRLLGTEGYLGVKTGTTRAAGACLIALGRRDGRSRIVVVLGSSGTPGRYADARNLFRWAWQIAE